MASVEAAQEVVDFLGDPALFYAAREVYDFVDATVRAYVRAGAGDVLPDDLRRVVVSSCARLVRNPELVRSESIGDYSVTHGAPFTGWTLPELAILNRYRRRAL